MNLVNTIEANGWLPSGLVLNTALVVKSASSSSTCVHVLPQVPLMDYGKSFVGVQQAGRERMLVLEGSLCSPAILLDLTCALSNAPLVVETQAPGQMFTDSIDPYSDPCMLMCPARFIGKIRVYSGSDIPATSIDIDTTAGTPSRPCYYASAYGTRANNAAWSDPTKALVVGGCCDIFLPARSCVSKLVIADAEKLKPEATYVYGLNCSPLSSDMLAMHNLKAGWAAVGRLGALSDIALQYTRRFTATHTENEAPQYVNSYSPWLRIVTRDGRAAAADDANIVVVLPMIAASRSYLQLVSTASSALIDGQRSVRDLLKAKSLVDYRPIVLADTGKGSVESALSAN